jgi:hypothetical protein
VYPLLTPPTLSGGASNRVCNALALLQCVANHNETRSLFLQGKRERISDHSNNNTNTFFYSTYSLVSLSLFKYNQQNSTL